MEIKASFKKMETRPKPAAEV